MSSKAAATFEKLAQEYKDIATAHCQPDSHHEQWVRSTASYIELFGQLTG